MAARKTQVKKIMSREDYCSKIMQIAKKQTLTITNGKKQIEVPVRVPVAGQLVTIDALNYVTSISAYDHVNSVNDENYFESFIRNPEHTDEAKIQFADELADEIAITLGQLFGKPFTEIRRNVKGLHGYKYQYTIGHDDYTLGKIAFGGNKSTVLIMITGKGCYEAKETWEYFLYDWLNNQEKAKITRIDLALDDFDGEFSSAEQANTADSQNKFSLNNRQPKVQHLGDWKRHEGEGRTIQVGKRENGKMYRGYEKGKQLGDPEHPWFRSEIEFKNKDRILPLEILINPTDYFAGAYPYALELIEYKHKEIFQTCKKIETQKVESEISFHKAVSIMKKQFGKYIKTFRELLPQDEKDTIILDLIQTDKAHDYVPKRLRVTDSYFQKLAGVAEPVNHLNFCPIPF